jgi:EAL domain-containing protein (putative c-di-GMP-specific phosphodiesterase class I)
MAITAEGVETQEQYDWLEGACQHAQGHFISRPIDAETTRSFLLANHSFRKGDSNVLPFSPQSNKSQVC